MYAHLLTTPAVLWQVLNELYSKPALFYRVGGGIPACVLFRDKLGIETTVLGVELDSDLMHAPNERCGLKPQLTHRLACLPSLLPALLG